MTDLNNAIGGAVDTSSVSGTLGYRVSGRIVEVFNPIVSVLPGGLFSAFFS